MSLIQRLTGVTLTSPGLKMYREALFNSGSLYCYDSMDSYSLNGMADGAVTPLSTMVNLINGGAAATWRTAIANQGTLTKVPNASGGGIATTVTNASWDVARAYDMNASQHAFLVVCWVRTGAQTANSQNPLMSFSGASFANLQYFLGFNPSTGALIANIGSQASNSAGQVSPSTTYQLAMCYYSNGGVGYIQTFKNGALVATQSSGVPTTIPEPDAGSYYEGFGFNGFGDSTARVGTLFGNNSNTWLRTYKEDLTTSAAATSKTPAAQALSQVSSDWNANHARFGI